MQTKGSNMNLFRQINVIILATAFITNIAIAQDRENNRNNSERTADTRQERSDNPGERRNERAQENRARSEERVSTNRARAEELSNGNRSRRGSDDADERA